MRDLHRNDATKVVGIWIRVSTDEQAQGDSPKHHELRARAYAESRGWTVREVYDLAGQSGKTVVEHPECRRMMADVKRGHITGLIFSKLARFARSTIELLKMSEFFQEHRADLVSLQEAIDTSTAAGRLFFSVNAALAQFEREEIASRVAASVPIRAKLGKPLGGAAPFGYQWKEKRLVPHPEHAAVRKLVYELFFEHKRLKTVARILNERGLKTRDGKSRKGGNFSDSTVRRLIEDTTAKGEHRLNYTTSRGDGKAWSLKPEHEWTVNAVEPIVPAELWERCNALLEARKVTGERPEKKGKSPFTGLVRCHCGKKMYIPFQSPKWTCVACKNKIPVADLEDCFRDEIKGFMVSAQKVEAYRESSRSGIAEKRQLVAKLTKDRDEAKTEADRCFDLYRVGALDVRQFKERFQPLDARRQALDREIPRAQAEVDALAIEDISAEHIAQEGRGFYEQWPTMDLDRKRSVAELLIKEVVVGTDDLTINLFTLPVFKEAVVGQRTLRDSSPPPA
ncbi:MAG TPA: recombinase family protein [Opitutaceae bacterium]